MNTARLSRGLIGLALLLGVVGCGPDPDPSTQPSEPSSTTFAPTFAPTSPPTRTQQPTVAASPTILGTHQTPDDACPPAWTGLEVSVDVADELEYLDSIPACTTDGTRAWLRNNSDVVWTINFPANAATNRTAAKPASESYRSIVGSDTATSAVFAPQDQIVIDAPPTSVSLEVSTQFSVAWETHTIAVEELASWGQAYAVEALRVKSATTTRSAVAQCTLSGFAVGATVAQIERPMNETDVQGFMTDVLGVGVASNKCWRATRSLQQPAGVTDDLATGMTRYLEKPTVLEGVHTRMVWVQRGAKLVNLFR